MPKRCAIVITSINSPTRAVQEIASDRHRLDARFVVVGDTKSPPDFQHDGVEYYDLTAQGRTGFDLALLAPVKHYARKNIGYLIAIKGGAEQIIETDDDNIPLDSFWTPARRDATAGLVTGQTWSNVYRHFTAELIWPRGLPLPAVRAPEPAFDTLQTVTRDCPIQQGLADGDPDVDAIYRLILPLPIHFAPGRSVILDRGVWCPFNSQNTIFFRDAFPLLYLPFHCSWRVTDIWRSLIAQRIGWENGWSLAFHSPTVFQDRNEHDLMRDFAEEVPGYLNNERIRIALESLSLPSGTAAVPDALLRCYELLVGMELVHRDELALVRAWLADLNDVT